MESFKRLQWNGTELENNFASFERLAQGNTAISMFAMIDIYLLPNLATCAVKGRHFTLIWLTRGYLFVLLCIVCLFICLLRFLLTFFLWEQASCVKQLVNETTRIQTKCELRFWTVAVCNFNTALPRFSCFNTYVDGITVSMETSNSMITYFIKESRRTFFPLCIRDLHDFHFSELK